MINFTQQHRDNLRKARLGKKHSEETKKKIGQAQIGRKFSEETKKKLSLLKKGKPGHPMSDKLRRILKKTNSGKNSHFWKGGISTYERKIWLNGNRRAKKIENGGCHTFGEWENLKSQYNWTCPCCKKSEPEIKLTRDHVIPLIKGGSDNIENIQPLCSRCNFKKHTKIIKY